MPSSPIGRSAMRATMRAHDRQHDADRAEHDQRLAAELVDEGEDLVEAAGDRDAERHAIRGHLPLDHPDAGAELVVT